MTSSDDLIRSAKSSMGASSAVPRRNQAVVTCMDTRIDPLRILNAGVGDIHVIRNAGALVTEDVERSLVLSQRELETTRIDLIMHTECGVLNLDEPALNAALAADGAPAIRTGTFSDLEAELRRGVALLRSNPALKTRSAIRGYLYDLSASTLRLVVDA
jgi:carbonic anhydrase